MSAYFAKIKLDAHMQKENSKYRDPETLSDSDEEIHPNIDTKSYRRFIKAQRQSRFEELKSKAFLSEEEIKEFKELEYKLLPVDREISGDTFRTSKEDTNPDYTDDLMILFNNSKIDFFIEYMDRKIIDLEEFEDLIYLNLSEAIKTGDDEIGRVFCKLGLLTKWTRMLGRGYIMKFVGADDKIELIVQDHYQASKEAILNLTEETI